MAVSLNDLFPMLRSAKGSADEHAAMSRGPWSRAKRKQPAGRRAAAPRASAISFETFEPRVLLSADSVVDGLTNSLTNGLTVVGTEIDQLIEDDPLFNKLVPGIVTTLEIGDNVYQVSPTLGDALEIKTDVYTSDYPSIWDFDPTGKSLADRYAYVNNSLNLQNIATFYGDAARDEAALKALDIDKNGGVSIDEAFSVFLAGRMQSYLGSTTILDQAGTPVGVDALDVAIQVRNAILTFDDAFGVIGTLGGLADRVQLEIGNVTSSFKNDTLTWNVEFSIALLQKDSFSLGYEAENLGIALDPADPPEQPNNDPFGFNVARTMSFGSFIFGVKSVSGGVTNDDFFFAVPDKASDPNDGMRVGVNIGEPGSPASLIGLGVNVGFLGATVINDTNTNADGLVLDMDVLGGAKDPSSAAALGFTDAQLGAINASGTVEAENVVDLSSLASNPVVFTLKIGTSTTAAETEITLASASYADVGAVVAALNAAIAAKGLGGIITASDGDADQKIEFTVVASNPAPLGFSAETGATTLISGTPTALVGKTAAQLSASPDASFLLTWVDAVTGQSISKVVTVNITTFSDDGADDTAGNADDLTTLEDVRAALQAGVDAAFGAGYVFVTTSGGNVRMGAGLNTIEISRKLTVDTLEQITLAELGTGDVFDVDADANASFDVYMLLKANSGLKDGDGNDYRPEGTIKVDIDPFDGNDVKGAKIDEDPQPPTTDIIVASYLLTDKDGTALKSGTSGLQTMLDFNVVSVADILGTFTQIGNWFQRVTSTEQLLGFDLPFLETSIGEILNLKDLITDTFLLDDGDDGVKAPNESNSDINDVEKLLKWVTVNGQQQLRSLFSNAQQLEKRLNELLPVDVDARVIVDSDNRQNLVYHLSAADVGIDVDSEQAGDQPLIVPLDFDLDLGPIGGFVTQGKLAITAEGSVGFDLGIILGNAVDVLDIDGDDSTEVQGLNSDTGVRINTNLALTTLGIIEPLVGRLSGDAVFRITMQGGAHPGTYEVTVAKSDTITNKSLSDLLLDLNTALQGARPVNPDGTLGAPVNISGQIVAASEPMQGTTKSVRLVLRAADAAITRFQVQTSITNPAYNELGLQTQSAATVSMVGSKPVSDTSPGAAVDLELVVKKGVVSTLTTVTLPTTGEFGTNDNLSLQSLVNDLNGVLAAANTGIVASQSGGRLVLSAVNADITGFTLKGATALGFDVDAANEALEALGVTETPTDLMVAGAVYRAGAGPLDPFGRLGVDVAFTINGEDVTLSIADTANNADVEDLARSLNAAIENNADLKGKVAAVVESGRLALRAIDASVPAITVAGLDGAGESDALGLANGSSIAGLYVRTTLNAPVSYGVSSDTLFTVTINGVDYDAELERDNTILNRSLYDLAASINNAINVAVGGANKNPLIATVQGGQIVIGVRTSAAGTGLVGDAYDPDLAGKPNNYVVKPSDVTGFSLNSANATFVNELKLLTAVDTEREANTADFVIYFADGTSAQISLDDLDPDKNQAVDEVDDGNDLTDDAVTLAQVIAAIYSQVNAQLPARTTGPGNQFEVRVALNGTSLQFVDRAGGSNLFRVAAVNGAPTAANLGILASDTSNNNINEVSATTAVRDGIIDGARIATIDFADRVWLDNVGASGSFEVKTQGEVSAEASFGFAGIRAFSSADQTLFSAAIDLPLFNGQKSLADLFEIFTKDEGAGVAALIGDPTLELSGDFSFKVEVLPGLNIAGFDMPENDASVTFKTDTVQIKLSDITDLEAGDLLDKITIEANNFDDLINFDQIKFDNVLDAVLAIADFLSQFEAFGFMDDDIPVLGVSVKDMLGVADEFLAAVNEFRDNPAGGIQQLSQKILESLGLPNFANPGERDAFFNNLGIPVPAGLNQLIEFAFDTIGGHKVLRLDLRFPIGFSEALNVDLDLGEILGTDLGPIDIQGGAGLAASGYLDARLSFGIDLDDPTKLLIYDDVTGVFGSLHAGANNVQFNAAIGPIGAFVKDGRVDLGLEFNVTGNDGAAGPSELGDFLSNLQASLTGSAEATLPVYFPSDSEYLGDITFDAGFTLDGTDGLQANVNNFELPDFSNIDLSALDPFASIPLMLDALDFFLMGLQDTLDGEVFGVQLPLIGNQLQGAVDFIEDMRRDLLAPLRQYIEQAPQLAEDVIEALLYELLADSSAQGMVNGQNIEDFLGIGGDIEGLGLLGDLNGIAGITQEDIQTVGDGNDGWQWIFNLGGSYQLDVPLDFDLGIPAIALEMNTALQFTLEWGLTFGVGISKQDGAYIYVGDDSELEITVAVDIPNQLLTEEASIRGELGFLQLEVWEDGGNAEGLENDARGTYLQAQFTVDLLEAGATGADADRVSFSELGNLDVEVGLQAEAEVNLFLKAAFNDSIVPDTIAALLPSISGRFILDWETGNVFSDSFDFADSLDILGFRDVKVDMGSFISDLLGPFVEKIAEVTGPLQPIIDVITAPIPVISDLAGQPISLVDIAGMTGYVEPAMIYAIADIITLVNKIGDASEFGEFNIPLGDFILLDKSLGNSGGLLTGSELLKDGYSLAGDPKFDGDPETGGALGTFLTSMRGAIGQADLGDFDSLLASGSGDGDSQSMVSDLKSGKAGGGFAFPIFDNPSLLFGLLLGKDVPLVTYDLAPFGMDFSYVQKFPIWDALFIRIGGSASLTIDLAFGYDTRGVKEFWDGGFTNPLDLLAGLYVSDTNQPTGEGVDVPELVLKGELFAGAELNLGIASAGAEGVIGLVTNFDLYDPDGDGKVRIDELVGNFLYEFKYGNPALAPVAIFDVYGQVYAQLRAFVEALFFKIDFEITPPITLFEFSIPFERQPFLATERGDGSLLLNMGPNAAQRLNGDTRDIGEKLYVKSLSDTEVLVWGMGIAESDGQKYQLKAGQGIYAYGGDGDDTIDLSGITHNIKYFIEGGAGDDTIVGGQNGGTIQGDSGNDNLQGGAGADIIYGGAGNDTIDGKDGDDIIFGDTGSITVLDGGITRFRSIPGDSDGDDKLYGGNGRDILIGAGGIDYIEGGEGDDIALGDGGNFDLLNGQLQRLENGRYDVNARGQGAKDTIFGKGGNDALFGGTGDDLIDGGADTDEIEAGEGFDVVYGGSGADVIYGGTQGDTIFGFRDPRGADFSTPGFDQSGDTGDVAADGIDTIFGEDGNDYIRGNAANDVIRGGAGADIIFGDEDDDEIYGEAGGDIMFGGADDDTIDGSDGADIAFGDDGLIVYIDYEPGKTDFNFTGSRIRYLGGGQLIGDGNESLIGDYATRDDGIATSMDLIVTQPLGTDGSDTIIGGEANDILFGGGGLLDTLFGDFNPAVGFNGPRPSGQDVMIGDGGRVELTGRRNARIAAESNALDGIDHLSGNDGGDYMFGGGASDVMHGFEAPANGGWSQNSPLPDVADNDVMLGDNGEILLDTSDAKNRIKIVRTTYVAGDSGRSDQMFGTWGNDVMFGGLNGSMDVIEGGVGQDILLGDQGAIYFVDDAATAGEVEGDGDLDTLDLIRSFRDGLGGEDEVSGGEGADVVIGGTAGDIMYGDNATASGGSNDGDDIMLGDNADVWLIGPTGRLLVQVAAMPAPTAVDRITTTDDSNLYGGADTMSGNAGNDIMLGGVNGVVPGAKDKLYGDRAAPNSTTIANDGDDIMLGDNGLLDFTDAADTDRMTLDLVRSYEDGLGGIDELSGGKGQDVGIGGTAGDTIFGDDASYSAGAADVGDILLGDNADIFLVALNGAAGPDLKTVLGAAIDYLLTTDEEHPEYGGVDTVSGNAGGDIIAGGVQGDWLYGDRETPVAATSALDGNDIMLGDNARLEWRSTGRFAEAGLAAFILANNKLLHDWFAGGADTDLGTLDLITTAQPLSGARDRMWGDEGSDLMFGGTDTDLMYGDDGDEDYETAKANQDVMFGDHGRVYPQFSSQAGILSRNFFAIDMGSADGGQGDVMYGEEGDDVMLGQQGDDRMWGGQDDDDMIGGHNRPGGYDELPAGSIDTQLPAVQGNAIADGMNDLMDGGSGDDAMAGDNAVIWRRGDDLSPRFRALTAATIYTTTETAIVANIGGAWQSDPEDAVGRDIELLDHSDDVQSSPQGRFGQDVMAGGADDDVMFGQLGDDLMQGDGSIGTVAVGASYISRQVNVTDSGANPDTDATLYFNIPEAPTTDGDDYMEGNGGRDLMYGGLGQDDMIGGSSALFGLTTEAMRPDDSDTMFGGAGIDTGRNHIGDATTDASNVITPTAGGNGLDADYMMGDNANVYRLVKGDASDAFLRYNYDASYAIRIIPRAMQQLDYSLGGADYNAGVYTATGQAQLTGQPADNGAADLIHGESGDDVIFGMTGSDVLFGDGQDDDIVGGYGHDWISGGTGQDGILGDDGLVLTSRNSTAGEPLNGIAGLLAKDPDTKYSDGNVLDELIATPGSIQTAVINKSGELKKTIDLVPFSYDSGWLGIDDEYPDNMGGSPFADDVIFGGLGSDWLHGGSGDDAISGAEALEHAFVPVYNGSGVAVDVYDLGFAAVGVANALIDNPTNMNPGNVLAFNKEDTDGQHLNNRFRAGEFRLYDEYDPRREILLTASGELSKSGSGAEFLLNFNEAEGVIRPAGTIAKSTGQQAESYPQVNDDGDDKIFGDLGNDWIVGGTGRDNVYGGWGNDLLNVDDNHSTNGGLNDVPDTHPTYEDRAYGGAGRDVLIGNTGGDRLIDWVGEYNSYLVPYAPFGQASVSRTLQPFLPEFLYALSEGDGADPTRASYTGDPRNGEPAAELGLVLQKDQAWQDQTGAPSDPQAGNIPGGKRDVLRSADFTGNQTQGFVPESGKWTVTNGRYEVSPLSGSGTTDAVSLWNVDAVLPSYFEIAATINAVKPTAGFKANAYVIFDYVSPTNFKFAGINVSTNKFEIGQRTAAGWQVLSSINVLVKQDTDYGLLIAINGNTVTAVLNGKQSLSYAYQPRTDADGFTYLIRDGMVGLGGDNARARIDNVRVQILPPAITYSASDTFDGSTTALLNGDSGNWALQGGRYVGTPAAGAPYALAGNDLAVSANAFLQLDTVVRTAAAGGIVFDMYSPTDFKWAAVSVATQQVLIGHYTAKGGWVVDAAVSRSLSAGTDYALSVSLKGTTVSVTLNGQAALSKVFNSTVVDGAVGTFARGGSASFDSFGFATDDTRFAATATATSNSTSTATSTKTASTSTGKLSLGTASGSVGAQKGWRIDWSATAQKTDGKRAAGEGVAKNRSQAWHEDFVLNMAERQAQRANHDLRVRL